MEEDHSVSSATGESHSATPRSSVASGHKKMSVDSHHSGSLKQHNLSGDDLKKSKQMDEETNEPKLKYPKSVFFIVVNEFCERFTFYGLRTLLSVYCNKVLHYSVDTSTVIYHSFVSLAYFTPLMGAFIADSFLGKFKTILYLSIVYAIGNVTLTVASADQAIEGMPTRAISILGLVIIAIGTGGIKPCVSAFGGDQFVVPQQQKQLDLFFSIFYFSVNSGSLVSTFITPILREDVQCFGKDSCYPLAYGVPAILMFIAIIAFVLGKPFYLMKKPKGNVLAETLTVVKDALVFRWKSKEKKDHWLDYARDKYDDKTVSDIKAMLGVAYLFIPLPIFWALYDQQGSRWTFQASRMNGRMGGFTMQPEQMQVVNPFLILLFVPLFEVGVYPLLAKCNILTKPLQRLGWGGVLAGIAFLLSAAVEVGLEPTYAVVPRAGEGQLRFYNTLNCPVKMTLATQTQDVEALGVWQLQHVDVTGSQLIEFKVQTTSACTDQLEVSEQIIVTERKAAPFVISHDTDKNVLQIDDNLDPDDPEKNDNTKPKLRIIHNPIKANLSIGFVDEDKNSSSITLQNMAVGTIYYEFQFSTYEVSQGQLVILNDMALDMGGVYTLLLSIPHPSGLTVGRLHTITEPNSVHMMLLMPQYIVMTAGEVMFSVTGLQFAFTQAPISMKSVLTSAWLMTSAVGNVIVAIIAGSKIFESQMYEFLLFAGIMFIGMLIFAGMAWNYTYITVPDERDDEEELSLQDKKNSDIGLVGIGNDNFKDDHEH